MLNTCLTKITGSTSRNDQKDKNTTPNINEKILRECYQLYTTKDCGLVNIAKELSLDILPPKKEVVILLLGNHSAGKSSFINWYVGENIQKAGVAIETQGFTFIQHGLRRESLLAESSLFLLPRFRGLRDIPGVLDFLTMEISASKQRKFNLVTFIDSPGLVDGGMEYPYDVNRALIYLGMKADLIFVFFDPIGQALCRRTLTVVEELSSARPDGLRFVLSKADEAGNDSDRQKVMMQIVQELCTKPGVNRQGFEMKSIYIPGMNRSNMNANHIEEICEDIEKTISFIIQKTLTGLENDCNALEEKAQTVLKRSQIRLLDWRGILCFFIAVASWLLADVNIKTTKTLDQKQFWYISLVILATALGLCFSNARNIFHINQYLRAKRWKTIIVSARKRKESLLLHYLGQSIINNE